VDGGEEKSMIALGLVFIACHGGPTGMEKGGGPGGDMAVVATVSPDYSVGALATVGLDGYDTTEEIAAVSGDPSVVYDGGFIWQLNRYMYDTIRKYSPADLRAPLAEVSISPESGSSNPHDVAVCGEMLLVTQYELPSILVLDVEDLAPLGQIDLSSYAEDGNPESSTMVRQGESVFVGLQNFERSGTGWVGVGSVVVEIGCQSLEVEQSWSFGNNLRLYESEEDGTILVGTSAAAGIPGGIYSLETETGAFELLVQSAVGAFSSVASSGVHLVTVEAAAGYTGYQIACHDLETGDSVSLGIQDEYLVDVASDSRGNAWVLSNFSWSDPSDSFTGIYVLDMASCSQIGESPIPFALGPYSIAIVE
jgi:hypothetical protein